MVGIYDEVELIDPVLISEPRLPWSESVLDVRRRADEAAMSSWDLVCWCMILDMVLVIRYVEECWLQDCTNFW